MNCEKLLSKERIKEIEDAVLKKFGMDDPGIKEYLNKSGGRRQRGRIQRGGVRTRRAFAHLLAMGIYVGSIYGMSIAAQYLVANGYLEGLGWLPLCSSLDTKTGVVQRIMDFNPFIGQTCVQRVEHLAALLPRIQALATAAGILTYTGLVDLIERDILRGQCAIAPASAGAAIQPPPPPPPPASGAAASGAAASGAGAGGRYTRRRNRSKKRKNTRRRR